jgi:lysophospholipase L1-like esterase
MKIAVTILLVVLLAIGYSAYHFMRKVRVSAALVAHAVPYTKTGNGLKRLLVLGDSTAVGVGADKPADTLAARVGEEIRATDVHNYAVSGARVADLRSQMASLDGNRYAYILIGIGANDVIRFGDPDGSAAVLSTILEQLPPHDHLIVYMAGNVGGAQLFPRILNPQYTRRTLAFHKAFAAVVSDAGGAYVNLYVDPAKDPFIQNPDRYLAADGLHPSSAGYLVWFEKIRTVLQ